MPSTCSMPLLLCWQSLTSHPLRSWCPWCDKRLLFRRRSRCCWGHYIATRQRGSDHMHYQLQQLWLPERGVIWVWPRKETLRCDGWHVCRRICPWSKLRTVLYQRSWHGIQDLSMHIKCVKWWNRNHSRMHRCKRWCCRRRHYVRGRKSLHLKNNSRSISVVLMFVFKMSLLLP